MSWRIVTITGVAKLDLKLGFMVVRKEETVKIHLSEIHTLLIQSTAVSITAALLSELVKQKIKVVFCDAACNPAAELLPYYGSHDTSLKVSLQQEWDEQCKGTVWTEIVAEKIRNQILLLQHAQCTKEACMLQGYLEEMEFADASNREGHAAKVYFNALFGMGFTRAQNSAINAGLNYGYTILLSAFNREIVAAGYLTQVGLFHKNRFNAFNLSSDLMEPFRPLVDELVLALQPKEFAHAEKMQLVNLLNKEVYQNQRCQRLHKAIQIYCNSVFDALCNADPAKIQFIEYEL